MAKHSFELCCGGTSWTNWVPSFMILIVAGDGWLEAIGLLQLRWRLVQFETVA